jgi:hypothetical protein
MGRTISIATLALLLISCGCAKTRPQTAAAPPAPKGRVQLWSENCQRCHNARPASWYSEREWEVAMHHMLVRGSITRREHDAVMEFFRASR